MSDLTLPGIESGEGGSNQVADPEAEEGEQVDQGWLATVNSSRLRRQSRSQ